MGVMELIVYAGIAKNKDILTDHSSVKGDWKSLCSTALEYLPSNHYHYSLSFEGFMIAFLRRGAYIYLIMCHEALGRSQAKSVLEDLSNEHLSRKRKDDALSKIKSLFAKYRGNVTPYKPLEIYVDAPKAYMIKKEGDEDPEETRKTPGRKSLQEELEELNDDKDEISITPLSLPNIQPSAKPLAQGTTMRPVSAPKKLVSVGGIMLPPGFARHERDVSSNSPSPSNSPFENPRAQTASMTTGIPRFVDQSYVEVEIPKYYSSLVAPKKNQSWTAQFPPSENRTQSKKASNSHNPAFVLQSPEVPKKFPLTESNSPQLHKSRPVSEVHLRSDYKLATSPQLERLESDRSKSDEFSIAKVNASKPHTPTGEFQKSRHKSGESARVTPEESFQDPPKLKGRIAQAAPSGLSWESEISRLISTGRNHIDLTKSSFDPKNSLVGIASTPSTPNSCMVSRLSPELVESQTEVRRHFKKKQSTHSDDGSYTYKKDRKLTDRMMPLRKMLHFFRFGMNKHPKRENEIDDLAVTSRVHFTKTKSWSYATT